MGILDRQRQTMLALTKQGEAREESSTLRKFALGIAGIARKPGQMVERIKGITEAAVFHPAEAGTWLTTDRIEAGEAGPMDACDLTAWLALAAKAGVPAVPGTVILRLTEEEVERASGVANIPTGAIPDRIRKRMRDAIDADAEAFAALLEAENAETPQGRKIDNEALAERLYACMDMVPEGWMVRTSQCGSSELKALAGTGLAGTTTPEVKFGPTLELGPGWVRNGNRRRVHYTDRRTMQAHAAGPHRGMTFIARPWVEAARYVVADDPHRHGSPFEGPGRWPMEWRAFVVGGQVRGVGVYYPWVGESSPENARIALEVRALAQRLVDTAVAQGLEPRTMDLEHARRNEQLAEMLDQHGFGHGSFCCTLDFIETKEGLKLLEGGPGHSPLGGGHCVAFAGTNGKPTMGNPMDTTGVAFRQMDHILIGEMDTWCDGDRTDRILDWDAVEVLAHFCG